MIKRSAAVANMKTKQSTKNKEPRLSKPVIRFFQENTLNNFCRQVNSGAGTAFNMNTNEVITNVALKGLGKKQGQYQFLHPNDHVNMSHQVTIHILLQCTWQYCFHSKK